MVRIHHWIGVLACILVVVPVTACEGGEAPEDTPGSALVGGDSLQVSAEPVLTIGAVDGVAEEEFGDVSDVAVVGDSVLAVVDRQLDQVRWFDLGGEYLGDSGGRGQGPGEIRARTTFSWADGDGGVAMYADGPGQVILHRPDGTFDDMAVPDARPEPPYDFRIFGRVFDTWVGLSQRIPQSPPVGDVARIVVKPKLLDDRGLVEPEGMEIPGPRAYVTETGPVWLPAELEPSPIPSLHGDVAAVLDQKNARVLLLGADLTWNEVELEDRCPEVPEGYLEDSEEGRELRNGIPLSGFRDWIPECLPPYDGVAVTGDGRVWVRLTPDVDTTSEMRPWVVVEGPGEPQRIVKLPPAFRPMDVRDGILYGRWTDALGVHHVHAYRVGRGRRPR